MTHPECEKVRKVGALANSLGSIAYVSEVLRWEQLRKESDDVSEILRTYKHCENVLVVVVHLLAEEQILIHRAKNFQIMHPHSKMK